MYIYVHLGIRLVLSRFEHVICFLSHILCVRLTPNISKLCRKKDEN